MFTIQHTCSECLLLSVTVIETKNHSLVAKQKPGMKHSGGHAIQPPRRGSEKVQVQM